MLQQNSSFCTYCRMDCFGWTVLHHLSLSEQAHGAVRLHQHGLDPFMSDDRAPARWPASLPGQWHMRSSCCRTVEPVTVAQPTMDDNCIMLYVICPRREAELLGGSSTRGTLPQICHV